MLNESSLAFGRARTMRLCPECGNPLQPVQIKTVKHLLKYPLSRSLAEGEFLYCSDPDCDLYYRRFASEDETAPAEVFRSDDIKERARPLALGRDRLICHCFGYTVGEIRDDADSGCNSVPAAIGREIRAGNCACEVLNPSGH
jgi:hypothetical protein